MTEEKTQLHLKAQDLLLSDRFSEVDSLYAAYTMSYPRDPAGYLFRAAALIAEMSDQEENLHGMMTERLLDSATYYAGLMHEASKDSNTRAWMSLWMGHARAYRSMYLARFGSLVAALKIGLAARVDYHRALREDSSLYDAYFGLGSYHYWKSAKAGILGWLRILKNEKDKGIRELRLAVDSSLLSKQAAGSALIWIWLDKKEFDSTIVYATRMIQRYPHGKSFLWPLAEARYRNKDYEQAIAAYEQLRGVLSGSPGNYYNLIEVDFQICMSLEKCSGKNEARAAAERCEKYLAFVSPDVRKRQGGKINYLRRMAVKARSG